MRSYEVLIVGGGPAGSTAAWQLRRAGADVLVLDRERFPRVKLCAGWITPEVVRELAIDLASYPHRLLTFPRLRIHLGRLHVPVPCVQYSIRRFEFDAWLLERSGAPVEQHNVRHIRADASGYIIDEAFRCKYLIGAGGTRCPVYRELFREVNPRESALQIVTLEHEIPYDWSDADCHLWFFEQGLPGYSWYVPKERGWLNVGVGAIAERMKARGQDIAGLASRDLGEGIGPAIRSGLRAARAILSNEPYRLDDVTGLSVGSIARSMLGRFAPAGAATGRRPDAAAGTGGDAHGLRHGDQ